MSTSTPHPTESNPLSLSSTQLECQSHPCLTAEEKLEARLEKKRLDKLAKTQRLARRAARLSSRPSPLTTFPGQHKWLGGAVDPETGYIYGIPSHYHEIICVKPPSSPEETVEISTIGLPNEHKEGSFKWLRGIIHEGYLYGIPAWNTSGVLQLRLRPRKRGETKRKVQILPLPNPPEDYERQETIGDAGDVDRARWMWHGGAIGESPTGPAIYAIPSNAQHVLKVNLSSTPPSVSEFGPLLEGQNKWYGGILGVDGCIYGIPYTATGVLRIDPRNDTVQVLGDFVGPYKWHGGLLAKTTGVIYAFPAHANEVLAIDTNLSDFTDQSLRVSTIPIQRHDGDTDSATLQYKWLGGSYGADDCIYGMPSDATSILRIDPINKVATTFGTVSEKINKWQGGVLSPHDQCIYAVPADMDCILRIHTCPTLDLKVDYVHGDFKHVEDKWQGGFLAKDGNIYGIPENIDNVLLIQPAADDIHPSAKIIL